MLLLFLLFHCANSLNCSGDLEKAKIVHRLLSSDYDEHVLPDWYGVRVFVELHIQDISDLSAATSDFQLEMFFSEIWTDPRLIYHPGCRSNITIKNSEIEEKMWTPNICITNSKANSYVHYSPIENQFLIIYANGTLWRNHRMKIRAPCRLNLEKFPFDSMVCTLLFESYSYNAAEVDLRWLPYRPYTYMGTKRLPEFTLTDIKHSKFRVQYPNGFWDDLSLSFRFERRYGYYILRNFVPTCLTVVVSWITFFLEERSNSARVTIGVSSLMALSFQFGSSNEQLPRASQLKGLDVWMLICITYVFLSLLELAVISRVARSQRRRNLKEITVSALWGLVGKAGNKDTVPELGMVRNGKTTAGPTVQIGSNDIDSLAAVLFPSSFFVLTAIYWMYYMR